MIKNFLQNFRLIQPVQAQTQGWADINQNCVVNDTATIQGIGCVLANVFSVALTLLGLTGFVMIIVSAFTMMLSSGKSQEVEKSKNTLTFAIVGIVLALSAFIILNLISGFTGVEIIKNFSIPGSNKNWEGLTAPSGTVSPTASPTGLGR